MPHHTFETLDKWYASTEVGHAIHFAEYPRTLISVPLTDTDYEPRVIVANIRK